mgnify:CR=1 FL=1
MKNINVRWMRIGMRTYSSDFVTYYAPDMVHDTKNFLEDVKALDEWEWEVELGFPMDEFNPQEFIILGEVDVDEERKE